MKPRALASQLKDRVRVQRPIDTHSPMGAVLAELQTISWGWGKLEANFGRDKLLATEVRDPGVDLSEVTGTLHTVVGSKSVTAEPKTFRFYWAYRGLTLQLKGFGMVTKADKDAAATIGDDA